MVDREPIPIVDPMTWPDDMARGAIGKGALKEWADHLLKVKSYLRANRRTSLKLGLAFTTLAASTRPFLPRSAQAAPDRGINSLTLAAENPNVWNNKHWHPVFRKTADAWKLPIMLNDPEGPAAVLAEVHSRVYGETLGILDEVNEKFRMWQDYVDGLRSQGRYRQAEDIIESAGHCPWIGAAGIMNPKPDVIYTHEFYGVQITPQTKVGALSMKWSGRPVRFWASRFSEDGKTINKDEEGGIGQIYAAVDQFKRSPGDSPFVFTESAGQVWDRNSRRVWDNDVVDGLKNTDTGEYVSIGPGGMTHAFAPATAENGIDLRASQKTMLDWLYESLVGKERFLNAVTYNLPGLLD